ncbi:MAG TPA: GNAT family N-acetyltransferase [Lichenihabitans sp.]|jgi:putative acetyltransferase|nr:GNAT family N-acetyltransferase [Lichenihabitans sp.]
MSIIPDESPVLQRVQGRLDPTPRLPAGCRWPEGLSLRPRGQEDGAALQTLLGQDGVQRSGSVLEPLTSPEEVEAFLDFQGLGKFEVVPTMREAIVGYAALYPLGGRQSHVGYFMLAVDERARRRGVGTALLAAVVETAWTMIGLLRLQLTVFVDNAPAIALYRRFGFAVEGRLACFARTDDGFVDAYVMAMIGPSN